MSFNIINTALSTRHYKGGLAITDLILEQLRGLSDYIPNQSLEAFFRFEDLAKNYLYLTTRFIK
jgi:hypothetical protein